MMDRSARLELAAEQGQLFGPKADGQPRGRLPAAQIYAAAAAAERQVWVEAPSFGRNADGVLQAQAQIIVQILQGPGPGNPQPDHPGAAPVGEGPGPVQQQVDRGV